MEKQVQKEYQPSEIQCKFYMARKKRCCKQRKLPGFEFCANHLTDREEPNFKRIPCPLDPTHTVYEHNLKKHLNICTALKDLQIEKEPFFERNLNVGNEEKEDDEVPNLGELLKDVTEKEFVNFVDRINECYDKYIGIIEDQVLKPDDFEKEYENTNRLRHEAQQLSIISHISKQELLNSKFTYVEFGAGKAELSFVLNEYLSKSKKVRQEDLETLETKEKVVLETNKFVLIDRSSYRRSHDHRLKEENKKRSHQEEDMEDTVLRLKMDICHLNLGKFDKIKKDPCVCLSKHLCGKATDLTLRCISQKMENECEFVGVFIALCCHHVCSWKSYANQPWFLNVGFSEKEFETMSRMSSWGTCGFRFDEKSFHLDKTQKEIVGRKCKRLIDWGRVEFLKDRGFKAGLVHYIPKEFSIENCLLFAKK